MEKEYDLIIIGGGPAGYVAAIRAAQLGLKTAVIEKTHLGGTCLNVGCIPTKTLFQSAEAAETVKRSEFYGVTADFRNIDFKKVMSRKDAVVAQLVGGVKYLLKKNKIDVIMGTAQFIAPKKIKNVNTGTIYAGKNILIAVGSENATPPIPGIDGRNIMGSTELLALDKLPESIAIIGGGVIGSEFANILGTFGVKVVVIEMLPKLLANMDEECSALIEQEFSAKGISVLTNTKVIAVSDGKVGGKEVVCEKNGSKFNVTVEYVLVAVGRKPCTANLGLQTTGIKTEKGFITVNDKMETSVAGVYAAGDVTGRSFLAHAAYEEGTIAVENIKGADRAMNFKAIPQVVFVETELAAVGLNEQDAKAAGYEVIVGKFKFDSNGKALAMGKNKGFVKVISEKENHEILGIHIAGPNASELITIGASLLAMEALLEDVVNTIYPHPSVSEAIREACMDALGCAVHA